MKAKTKTAKTLKPLPAPFAPSLKTIGRKKAAKAEKVSPAPAPAGIQMSAYTNTPAPAKAPAVFTPGAKTTLSEVLAGKMPTVPPGSANPKAAIPAALAGANVVVTKATPKAAKEPSKRTWTVDQIVTGRKAEDINAELGKKWPGDFNADKSLVSINTYRSDARFYFRAFLKAGLINTNAAFPELLSDIVAESK